MFLSDTQIKKRTGMIEPFVSQQIKYDGANGKEFTSYNLPANKLISYGLSSYGYDARLDNTFLIPRFDFNTQDFVDPKNTNVSDYENIVRDVIKIPPSSFILAQTVEAFDIPRDIVAWCLNKSTYARCGVNVSTTILEPGWKGHLTLEIANLNTKPAVLYAGEGICQIMFSSACVVENNICEVSYADRNGKYQNQKEVTISRI